MLEVVDYAGEISGPALSSMTVSQLTGMVRAAEAAIARRDAQIDRAIESIAANIARMQGLQARVDTALTGHGHT
jgi:hypothetical protein